MPGLTAVSPSPAFQVCTGTLVSWWHTDGDMGRTIKRVNHMTQSRLLGFHAYPPTPALFFERFDRLKAQRIIPG